MARGRVSAVIAALFFLCGYREVANGQPQYSAPVKLGFSLGQALGSGRAPVYYHFAVADFNCDGREDAVVTRAAELRAEHPPYPIMILLNDGGNTLVDGTAGVIAGEVPTTFWPKKIIAKDFNGDGRPDIFIVGTGLEVGFPDYTDYPGEQNRLLLSTPECKLVDRTSTHLPQLTDFSHGADADDVDGDGDLDIWVNNLGGNPANSHAYLMLNDGSGRFSVAADLGNAFLGNVIVGLGGRLPAELLRGWAPLWAQFVDADGDGDPDLHLGYLENFNGSGAGRTVLLVNDGGGRFSIGREDAIPPPPFGGKGQVEWSEAADVNGDGVDDLILHTTQWGTYLGFKIQLLIANGDGTFRDETAQRLPPQTEDLQAFCTEPEFSVRDLNGDGHVDIFFKKFGVNCANPITAFYINDGRGFFYNAPGLPEELKPHIIPIDLDGDGVVEFVDAPFNGQTGEFELRLTRPVGLPDTRIYVSVDGRSFRPGQTMHLGLTAQNAPGGQPLAVHVGILLPDGDRVAFFSQPGVMGGVGSLSTLSTLGAMQLLGPGQALNIPQFLTVTLPEGVPDGRYVIFAALIRPGALDDNAIEPGDIVATTSRPVTIRVGRP